MPVPLREIYEELQFVSDRISTQVRTISLSVLALVWLFLAGGSGAPALLSRPGTRPLLEIASLALAALVSDYLQYFFGYLASDAVRKTAERARADSAEYSYTDLRYRARTFCFWLKQLLTIIAVGWLIVAILQSLIHSSLGAA